MLSEILNKSFSNDTQDGGERFLSQLNNNNLKIVRKNNESSPRKDSLDILLSEGGSIFQEVSTGIPSIPESSMLKEIMQNMSGKESKIELPENDIKRKSGSYESYSATAANIFQDVSKLFSESPKSTLKKSPPPLKPKPKGDIKKPFRRDKVC